MSFALLDRLRRNVSVRLSLWFTLLFAAGTAAVVLLVYYLVAQELQSLECHGQVSHLTTAFSVGSLRSSLTRS